MQPSLCPWVHEITNNDIHSAFALQSCDAQENGTNLVLSGYAISLG